MEENGVVESVVVESVVVESVVVESVVVESVVVESVVVESVVAESVVAESVPEEIQVVITAALSRYLQDEKLSFKVITIKPVQSSQINFWGIVGRRDNMMKLPR